MYKIISIVLQFVNRVVENLPKALVGVSLHLLRWIVIYPADKVIHSLNNWGQVNICDGIGYLSSYDGFLVDQKMTFT